MATFITSKSVGQTMNIYVQTSTGFWKYNHDGSDSSMFGNGNQTITVANVNGEFTIISCLSDGTVSGDITQLNLGNNLLTSFDGTSLTSLTNLNLYNNQLTSLVGFIFPTSLTNLQLGNNQLTSFDATSFTNLVGLVLTSNPLTPSVNNQILNQLNQHGLSGGYFESNNGRSSASITDYNNLVSLGWEFSGLQIIDTTTPPTFITSKAVGESININVQTSTGYWKYNHNGSDSSLLENTEDKTKTNISITNVNGEFTIIPCDLEGNVTGNITHLHLYTNQLTSFDGTGLSGLTELWLSNNQLTSFDGTGLSSLTQLGLYDNQLTSFDGTGLSSLTGLNLGNNQLTPSVNNQILDQFNQIGLSGGYIMSSNGRTSASNADYDNLVNNLGWTFDGFDLIIPPTFITSKAVGESINIYAQTSTGFWKYKHGGVVSSVNVNGWVNSMSVTNANGEFAIIPCDSNGTVSGDLTQLHLPNNQLTSFDGTDLSSLIELYLYNNQLTSFDGTGLSSLTQLRLENNQLTSFDGTGLSSLTSLELTNNQFTSFDGTGLSSLTQLNLNTNQLTSFDGTGLSSLIELYLYNNQLTSFDGTGLSSLTYLEINGNPFTPSVNNQILNQLNQNGLSGGEFYSSNGRTLASNTDYDNLLNELGWTLEGLDLIIPPTFITSKAVGDSISINVNTSTGYWKYNHDGSDSSVFSNGPNTIPVSNINGEFTIISCDSDGTVSGDLTQLYLGDNQLTSFDGTGLTSLTDLRLSNNQLTSFDGTGLSSLTNLYLSDNQLTSLDGFIFPTSLTDLGLSNNLLTSFDGTGLSSLTQLQLQGNLLTSLDISPLVDLSYLCLFEMGVKGNPDSTNPITTLSNNQIVFDLSQHSINGGTFISTGGRTSASNVDYDNLVNNLWSFQGLDLITTTPPTFITSKAVGETINIGVSTSTEYWKYNHDGSDSSVFGNGSQTTTVSNANGEFTLISCDESGNISGDLTHLYLDSNQLTSFDGNGLSGLTELYLYNNQLTSFDGTGLSSLTDLSLNDNQLTSFDGTGLSSLTNLGLDNNQLTSFDLTGLSGLIGLYLNGNPMTPSSNNQILNQLNQNGLSGGNFYSSNGRTSSSNTDYDNLLNSLGWYFEGLDLIVPPPVGNGKLRVKGFRPTQPQPWDGGTIYNIGAVVTHEGQTWNCIQYAPSGYGPFGGYIDVYWTLLYLIKN